MFASIQARIIFRVSAAGGSPEKAIEGSRRRGPRRLALVPSRRPAISVSRPAARHHGAPDARGSREALAAAGADDVVGAIRRSGVHLVRPGRGAAGAAVRCHRRAPDGRAHLDRRAGELFPVDRLAPLSPRRRSGTIVYQSHDDASRLTWFDLAGRALESIGPPGNYLNLEIDREGRRIFYDRTRPDIGTFDIWSLDLDRGVETPITTDTETEVFPMDLPGGKSIVYSANRGGAPELFRRSLESGAEERLTKVQNAFQQAQDLSPDGKTLVYVERTMSGYFDIWTLPLSGSGEPAPVPAVAVRQEGSPVFSGRPLSRVHFERVRPGRGLRHAFSRAGREGAAVLRRSAVAAVEPRRDDRLRIPPPTGG